MNRPGYTSYAQAKLQMSIHQENFQDRQYVLFKPSFKTFHFCPLSALHKIPLKHPDISSFELVSDGNFSPNMGCHTYLDIDIVKPYVTYRQVIDRVTTYILDGFAEFTNAKVDVAGFRFFWCVADDDPKKLSIHGTIQHPCFVWKYGFHKTEHTFSLRDFIKLVNKRILEKNDNILLGVKTNDDGEKTRVSYIDEAPYNTKGNAAMRLCGTQ